MKWEVTGVWTADGGEASMTVEAPNQRAAEAIATQRGMAVEQAIPAATPAQPVVMNYAPPMPAPAPRVQTVQATGKLWKFLQLVGVLAIIYGVIAFFVSMNGSGPRRGPDPFLASGILAFVGGFVAYVIGRVCAWWFHG